MAMRDPKKNYNANSNMVERSYERTKGYGARRTASVSPTRARAMGGNSLPYRVQTGAASYMGFPMQSAQQPQRAPNPNFFTNEAPHYQSPAAGSSGRAEQILTRSNSHPHLYQGQAYAPHQGNASNAPAGGGWYENFRRRVDPINKELQEKSDYKDHLDRTKKARENAMSQGQPHGAQQHLFAGMQLDSVPASEVRPGDRLKLPSNPSEYLTLSVWWTQGQTQLSFLSFPSTNARTHQPVRTFVDAALAVTGNSYVPIRFTRTAPTFWSNPGLPSTQGGFPSYSINLFLWK